MRPKIFLLRTPTGNYHCRSLVDEDSASIEIKWIAFFGHACICGESRRHPDDVSHWPTGVAVALRRAIRGVVPLTRQERRLLRRAFYQAWPEAHPEYRVKKGWDLVSKDGDKTVFVNGQGDRIEMHRPVQPHSEQPYRFVGGKRSATPHPPMSMDEIRRGTGHMTCIQPGICQCPCLGCASARS